MPAAHHSFFTGQMPCQSTEGTPWWLKMPKNAWFQTITNLDHSTVRYCPSAHGLFILAVYKTICTVATHLILEEEQWGDLTEYATPSDGSAHQSPSVAWQGHFLLEQARKTQTSAKCLFTDETALCYNHWYLAYTDFPLTGSTMALLWGKKQRENLVWLFPAKFQFHQKLVTGIAVTVIRLIWLPFTCH